MATERKGAVGASASADASEPEDDEDFVDDFKPQKVRDDQPKRRQRPEEPKVKVGAARKPFTVSDDDDDGGWPDDE